MFEFPLELNLILKSLQDEPEAELEAEPEADFVIPEDFNWGNFMQMVKKHKLSEIVHGSLQKNTDAVLPKILNKLKRQTIKNHVQSLAQVKTLGQLSQEFAKHEVEVLFIKGLTINSLHLDKNYQRAARDIDFLLPWHKVRKASMILDDIGFQRLKLNFKKGDGSLDFRHRQTKILLELHWNLWSKRDEIPTNFYKLWHKRKIIEIHKHKLATLDPETHISYLCYHGTVHFWYRLFWLYDIALIVKNKDIDWLGVEQAARQNGVLPSLYLALSLCNDLLKIPVPLKLSGNVAKMNINLRQKIFKILAANPSPYDFEPKNPIEKIKRIGWKLITKSRYRWRTIYKLLRYR